MALALKILRGRVTVNGFMFQANDKGGGTSIDTGSLPPGVDPKGDMIQLPGDATVRALSNGQFQIFPLDHGTLGKVYAEVSGDAVDWIVWVAANDWTSDPRENRPVSYVLPTCGCSNLFELQVNEGRVRIGRY